NAGSSMQALVQSALLRLSEREVPAQTVLEATRILTDCVIELTEGQYLDMSYEGRFDVTLDDYFAMTGRKTGALFEASTWLGALLATEDEALVSAWRTVGRAFGLAFQARDDALGIWEKTEATGKVVGGDIYKRKKSLPVAYVLTHGSGADKQVIADVFAQPRIDAASVERVVAVLDRLGAQEYCREVVHTHTERARAALAQLPAGPAVEEVRSLIDLIAE
ncbi:MAG TPA: polyprenyl synthetase family protein, partial [Armatimonadota bacterium]|nr:polyprenyl synthetase family protein [Armatimonadota bacterium]